MSVSQPLTQAQAAMWLDYKREPESAVNNTAERIALRGPLDLDRLRQAILAMQREAEALHIRFFEQDGEPRQRVGEATQPPIALYDLTGAADPLAAADRAIQQALTQRFSLEDGHLYDQTLYRLAPDHHLWVFRAHHITLDGYGFQLCKSRVAENYRALGGGGALPPAFSGFGPVIAEDLAYQRSAQRALDREALMRVYDGLDLPPVLFEELGLLRGSRASTQLPAQLGAKIRKTASEIKVSWPNLLFGVVAAFHARLTGERDVLLGVPVMQRMGSAALKVPCMAMNMIPLRIRVDPGDTLPELARRASRAFDGLRPHQRYHYMHLWHDMNQKRLFGPEVNVIPFNTPLDFGPELTATVTNVASGPVEDLSFAFSSWGDSIQFTLDGHPSLYDQATLEAHQRSLVAALDEGCGSPAAPAWVS
ncbi:condensation domain-containing protein [Sorangium cellulosum]|uniref:Condensation domain-containing protein n=1 Tax=Sorangium cellulosum TaxID=56 RepID=A0A2L0EVD4_SORCE|nr:condensation domain-containing protein [Sorangium cellulosum]AUX43235.1 condensation domain-containing protein [Sorangium cellulosum]